MKNIREAAIRAAAEAIRDNISARYAPSARVRPRAFDDLPAELQASYLREARAAVEAFEHATANQ